MMPAKTLQMRIHPAHLSIMPNAPYEARFARPGGFPLENPRLALALRRRNP
jgi:hypothetical protein